jgi:hypothetical protein
MNSSWDARRGTARCGRVRLGLDRYGLARRGEVRRCEVGRGGARVVLTRLGVPWLGKAWRGPAWCGGARRGQHIKRCGHGSVALVAAMLLLSGCGDEYEKGAGVFTATATQTTPATSVVVPVAPVAPQASKEPVEGPETGRLSKRQERIGRQAIRAARQFLGGYLDYSYGERVRVHNVFPGVLPKDPPRVPPGVERPPRPRLEPGGLDVTGMLEGRVFVTARLSDGQVRSLVLRRRGGSWAVSEVR